MSGKEVAGASGWLGDVGAKLDLTAEGEKDAKFQGLVDGQVAVADNALAVAGEGQTPGFDV